MQRLKISKILIFMNSYFLERRDLRVRPVQDAAESRGLPYDCGNCGKTKAVAGTLMQLFVLF